MNEDSKELLNNLINSIQEKMNSTSSESNETSDTNTSSFDVSSILNTLNSNNTETKNESPGIDPSLILKIQKIMSSLNSASPQKDLLLSLKPFLRKSRQNKINEYLTILSFISVLDSFKDKGSD